jgi:hypothetical protein
VKNKGSIIRKIVYLLMLFAALFAGYFIYDMSQAGQMAANACMRATPGMPVEVFLSKFSEKDYKIIQGAKYLMIVPKKGLGRNHCKVEHDGLKISSAKAGFND